MEKIKIGYKMVRVAGDGKLHSFNSHYKELQTVVYLPQKWVKPNDKCGPLAVFKDKKDAIKTYIDWKGYPSYGETMGIELWECEYEPSRKRVMFYKRYSLHRYLGLFRQNISIIMGEFPSTTLTLKVKLLRKVTL